MGTAELPALRSWQNPADDSTVDSNKIAIDRLTRDVPLLGFNRTETTCSCL